MRRTVATLIALVAGLAICTPATASAAPATHCTLRLETGVVTCGARLAAVTNNDVIIGRVFDDQNYGGSSFTITGSHPCKDGNGRDFGVQLAKYGWANRISSLQAWGNCWLNLYSGPNYNGDHDGEFKADTPYVGPLMDKRTQSIGFD